MNRLLTLAIVVAITGCLQPEATGLARTEGSGAKVTFDIYAKPLPEIPLPNDFATRFDATTPTRRRINASTQASTKWETATRAELDNLDGWGTYETIAVSFEKPLDLQNLVNRHQGDDYAPENDAVLLIDVTPDSPEFCSRTPLDMGEGNFPIVLESPGYFDNDRPGDNLLYDDREEDLNGNGQLDLGEDLDMDGVLDHPNVLNKGDSTFQVMNFYERETNTLLMKPVLPLREKTTYAVVLTKRLVDADGKPVTSPFPYVNHASQTPALKPLEQCLPMFGLGVDDIAFTWSYTTQNVTADYVAIRDGMYGLGPMKRLATEFPAVIKKIMPMKDDDQNGTVNIRIVRTEEFLGIAMQLLQQLEGDGATLTPSYQAIADSHQYVDYHAVFQFDSPQFFPRYDSEGKLLPLYKQLIQVDPITGAAFTRPETITVWVVIPKIKPADGSPPPAVILGHGYGSNKMEALFYAGFLARFGIATIALENVSHGIDFDPVTMDLAEGLFQQHGLGNMFNSIARNGRAFDQNGDGVDDSGADFWTAYIIHTREVVKQSALDYMQLVKLLRGFDGKQRTNYDSNHDGVKDLAGDFDGDGKVDLGGPDAKLSIMGGSLGGIMSGMMSGLEPALQQAVPISGGAGLPDIGIRSIQGGVREAVNLRMLGPLFVTIPNNGVLEAWQELPDLAGLGKVKLGVIDATPQEGDTAVLTNVTTGERRCARVEAEGRIRAAVSSDQEDHWELKLYTGALPPKPRDGCDVPEGTEAYFTFNTFQEDVTFQGVVDGGVPAVTHKAGSPLVALGDGFGLRRQSPELRRFMGLAQLAIERGDPVNFVPYGVRRRELVYGNGEKVDTHFLVVNTIGDMNVPVATGISLARVAGILEIEKKDERYGKTPNRVLIDTGTLEAVERVGRNPNSVGAPVLMDIDRLSLFTGSTVDKDGFDVPRLNPPMRMRGPAKNGGITGMFLPMVVPTGRHGFDTPDPSLPSNLGAVLLNSLGRFMTTDGEQLPDVDPCLETSTCDWIVQSPP